MELKLKLSVQIKIKYVSPVSAYFYIEIVSCFTKYCKMCSKVDIPMPKNQLEVFC